MHRFSFAPQSAYLRRRWLTGRVIIVPQKKKRGVLTRTVPFRNRNASLMERVPHGDIPPSPLNVLEPDTRTVDSFQFRVPRAVVGEETCVSGTSIWIHLGRTQTGIDHVMTPLQSLEPTPYQKKDVFVPLFLSPVVHPLDDVPSDGPRSAAMQRNRTTMASSSSRRRCHNTRPLGERRPPARRTSHGTGGANPREKDDPGV